MSYIIYNEDSGFGLVEVDNTGSVIVNKIPSPDSSKLTNDEQQILSGGSFEINTYFSPSCYIELYEVNPQTFTTSFIDDFNYSELNPPKDPATNLVESLTLTPFDDFIRSGTPEIDNPYVTGRPISAILQYNFYENKIGSSLDNLFITEISPDRTELSLSFNEFSEGIIIEQTQNFISQREDAEYFLEFFVKISSDLNSLIGVNLKLNEDDLSNPLILIKILFLYNPQILT